MLERIIKKGIVSSPELRALLDQGFVKVLDASFALPGAGNPAERFEVEHIPGAQFFDIEQAADPQTGLPHMLPAPGDFAAYVSSLGIGQEDTVVLYGQDGMLMGPPRAWWMFRVFGHEKVCVLDGGLPAWKKAGYPVASGLPRLPAASSFTAHFQPSLVCGLGQVRDSLHTPCRIVDARPAGRFSGTSPEPRPGLRAGHIPGSVNLPATTLINPQGTLRPEDEIRAAFQAAGYEEGQPAILTCGSGVTACMLALALYAIGQGDAPVYDGSWSEWGLETSLMPVEVG
ncbi:MAG: sulfurtransferase [Alphaproteobacteria bacterium]|nr:sulfurtransferase [Alphaproteobacteria bacterium]